MGQTQLNQSVSSEVVRSTQLCCSLNLLSCPNKLIILSEQHIKLSERDIKLSERLVQTIFIKSSERDIKSPEQFRSCRKKLKFYVVRTR